MKRILLLSGIFLIGIGSAPLCAEQSPPQKVEQIRRWFMRWASGLKKSSVQGRFKNVRTTAVAAVRGSKQDSNPNLPYWKGTWSDKKSAEREAERKELEASIELVLAGNIEGAGAALDAFEKKHPKSTLLADVAEARLQLTALKEASAPPVEEVPEAVAPPEEVVPVEEPVPPAEPVTPEEPKAEEPKAEEPKAEEKKSEAPKETESAEQE